MDLQQPVRKSLAAGLAMSLACLAAAASAAPQSPGARPDVAAPQAGAEAPPPAAAVPRPGVTVPRQGAAAARPGAEALRPSAATSRPSAGVQRQAAAPRVSANSFAYFTSTPCRVFDTRMPADTPALQVGVARLIQVTGVCGVPAGAAAVAVNLAVTNATAAGGLELYPGDGSSSMAVIDFPVGRPRANNAVVQLASNGAGTLKALYSASGSNQTVDFILDLSGYFMKGNPVAVDDSYSTTLNTALNQPAPGVLANDTLNGATIFSYGATTGAEQTTIGAATPTSAAGSVSLNADGSFGYTPANGFVGSDTFKYVIKNSIGSSTATVTIGVGKADQTITFTSTAPSPGKVGTTYNVTATASSGLTVTFTIDAGSASVCSISGSTVSFNHVGSCVIDANQAGNADWNPAPQAQQSVTVNPGDQTITFTSTPPANAKVGGPTYNVTATASSGLTVTFTIDAGSASVCSISSSTVSFIGAGTCTIDANQGGNADYNAAPQGQQPVTVGPGDQTITYTSTPPSPGKVGTTYNVTATASSGLPVTFSIDAGSASVCSITASIAAPRAQAREVSPGPVPSRPGASRPNPARPGPSRGPIGGGQRPTDSSATVTFNTVGTCVIDANQAGNANWNPAPQAQQSVTVNPGDQTITFTSTPPSPGKVGTTYNVTATASSGLTVAFTIDAGSASLCSISGSTVSFNHVGTCVIDANQAGDANWNPAPQKQQSVTVNPGDQTITFTSTPPANAKNHGPNYIVAATASSGLTVSFTIDAGSASVCSISGSTVSFIGAGTCTIDANQGGNADYNAAPQKQQPVTVAPGDQTITFTSTPPTNATPGIGSYTVTATATSGLTVTFTIDASASSVCSISGSTVSFTADGTCVVDAHQAGDSNWNAAPQVQQSFVVDTPPTVNSTSPASNATSVPLASTISITFSKAVTVTGTAFSLACSPGTAPGFTVTPVSPATTYVLHPSANLPFDSSCTVTVSHTQVTDAANRTMTADYMFSFATPPIANNDSYPEALLGNVSADSGVTAAPNFPFSVLTNDQFNSPVTITAFDATSLNGGTVSMNTSNGRFTYTPAAGYTGGDSFTYTIGNAHGSSTATVSLTISGIVWFIDKSAGAGDGRLSSPFNSLAAFQAVNDGAACNALNTPRCHPAANANIFIYDNASAYTGPVILLNGQKLIGQDATSSLATIAGVTLGSSQAALPATGGGSPNKVSITATGNDVTLGSGNTVWGLTLGNATSGIALSGASVGSLKLRDLTINTTGGAVSLANGALDAIVHSISSSGGTHGISLTTTTGSFDVEGDGASDPANTTRGRTTAKNGGGTLTLGSGGTIQNATSAGVLLSTATNVTLRNMTIQNNGSGINTGGDGITVTNGSAMTFDNDLIQNQAGNYGLHATGLAGATLVHDEITGNATTSGVQTPHVWNVRLDNVTGAFSINDSLFHNSLENVFGLVDAGSRTVTVTATNSEWRDTAGAGPPTGNVCLYLEGNGTANVSLNLTGSTIKNCYSSGVTYNGNETSGGGTFTVKNNIFDGNGAGTGDDIAVAHNTAGTTYTFDIENNTTRQILVPGSAVSISADLGGQSTASSLLQGKILNNTIGNAAVANSGSDRGSGIGLQANGAGTLTATVSGNTVREVGAANNDGLGVLSSGTTDTINVTVTNNDLSVDTDDVNSNAGVELTAGGNAGSDTICAHLSGNVQFIGNTTASASTWGVSTTVLGSSTILLEGYGGAANDSAAIATFLNSTATTVNPSAQNLGGGGTVKKATSPCPTPP